MAALIFFVSASGRELIAPRRYWHTIALHQLPLFLPAARRLRKVLDRRVFGSVDQHPVVFYKS